MLMFDDRDLIMISYLYDNQKHDDKVDVLLMVLMVLCLLQAIVLSLLFLFDDKLFLQGCFGCCKLMKYGNAGQCCEVFLGECSTFLHICKCGLAIQDLTCIFYGHCTPIFLGALCCRRHVWLLQCVGRFMDCQDRFEKCSAFFSIKMFLSLQPSGCAYNFCVVPQF